MNEKRNLLVIDDDEYWIKQAKQRFERRIFADDKEFNVYSAMTIEDGLKIIKQNHIDIVLLDIEINQNNIRKSGINDFLKPVRAEGIAIPIVCWSSDKDYDWRVRMYGADGFIYKEDVKESTLNLYRAINGVMEYRRILDSLRK